MKMHVNTKRGEKKHSFDIKIIQRYYLPPYIFDFISPENRCTAKLTVGGFSEVTMCYHGNCSST